MTRAALVESEQALLSERGFHATSISDIKEAPTGGLSARRLW